MCGINRQKGKKAVVSNAFLGIPLSSMVTIGYDSSWGPVHQRKRVKILKHLKTPIIITIVSNNLEGNADRCINTRGI